MSKSVRSESAMKSPLSAQVLGKASELFGNADTFFAALICYFLRNKVQALGEEIHTAHFSHGAFGNIEKPCKIKLRLSFSALSLTGEVIFQTVLDVLFTVSRF